MTLQRTFEIITFLTDFTESASDVLLITADERLSRRNNAVTVNLQTSERYWIIQSHLNLFSSVYDQPSFSAFSLQKGLIRVFSAFSIFSFIICIILLTLKFSSWCLLILNQALQQLILLCAILISMSIMFKNLSLSLLIDSDYVIITDAAVKALVVVFCEFTEVWSNQLISTSSSFSLYKLHKSLSSCSLHTYS